MVVIYKRWRHIYLCARHESMYVSGGTAPSILNLDLDIEASGQLLDPPPPRVTPWESTEYSKSAVTWVTLE